MWTKKDNIATLLTWHRSWWTRSGREKTEIWPKVNWRSVKVLLYQQPLHQLITAETVSKCNHQGAPEEPDGEGAGWGRSWLSRSSSGQRSPRSTRSDVNADQNIACWPLGHWECLKIDLFTCVLPGSTMEFQIGDIEPWISLDFWTFTSAWGQLIVIVIGNLNYHNEQEYCNLQLLLPCWLRKWYCCELKQQERADIRSRLSCRLYKLS